MLYSMTGFGKAGTKSATAQIEVEIKSLNSKFLDIRPKIPKILSNKELEIRKIVGDQLMRGKIDVVIDLTFDQSNTQSSPINWDRFRAYTTQFQTLQSELQLDQVDIFNAVMRIPDVIEQSNESMDESLWHEIESVLKKALEDLTCHRLEEGKSLENDLRQGIEKIQSLQEQIEPLDEKRLENIRTRLDNILTKQLTKETKDESRFEQELIYYAERYDINEEKVRLRQHCKYFFELLDDTKEEQKGKKLGFVSQEIGREINTLGAKAYDADIQKIVVLMKNELERIKEQIANAL